VAIMCAIGPLFLFCHGLEFVFCYGACVWELAKEFVWNGCAFWGQDVSRGGFGIGLVVVF